MALNRGGGLGWTIVGFASTSNSLVALRIPLLVELGPDGRRGSLIGGGIFDPNSVREKCFPCVRIRDEIIKQGLKPA